MNQSQLLDQVRTYSEALVEDLPEPVRSAPSEVRPSPRPIRMRGIWVGVSAAVFVIVLFGLVPLLLNIEEVPPGADSDSWSLVVEEPVLGGPGVQEMLGVVDGGPGLVAVGTDNEIAAVWTSDNGVDWLKASHEGSGFVSAEMRSVTGAGPGLVAVGRDGSGYAGDWDAAVWTSVDGTSWSRVPHDPAVFGEAEMLSVTVGGPGLVAVGQEGTGYSDTAESLSRRQDAAVWTSKDGTTWSRVPPDSSVFGGDGNQSMVSVTEGESGLVAVGWNASHAAVWTSVDGVTWLRAPHDLEALDGGGRPSMVNVTTGGPGFVAVGSDGSNAAVWTSTDGVAWLRVHDESLIAQPNMLQMTSVTDSGSGLVAVGFERLGTILPQPAGVSDAREVAAVWVSDDGIEWSRVAHDESVFDAATNQRMLSATVWKHGLVAVGSNSPSPTWDQPRVDDGAVWLATP